jgi:hypothetical protein
VRDAAQLGFVPSALSGLDREGPSLAAAAASPPWAAPNAWAAGSPATGVAAGVASTDRGAARGGVVIVGVGRIQGGGGGGGGGGGLTIDPRLLRFSPALARHSFRARRVAGAEASEAESKQTPPPPSPTPDGSLHVLALSAAHPALVDAAGPAVVAEAAATRAQPRPLSAAAGEGSAAATVAMALGRQRSLAAVTHGLEKYDGPAAEPKLRCLPADEEAQLDESLVGDGFGASGRSSGTDTDPSGGEGSRASSVA